MAKMTVYHGGYQAVKIQKLEKDVIQRILDMVFTAQ